MRNASTLVVCGGMLLAAGCGAASGYAAEEPAAVEGAAAEPAYVEPSLDDRQLVAEYDTDVEDLEAQLLSSFEPDPSPDCVGGAEARDRICDLSERICGIAERHPSWTEVEAKCGDARERCQRARDSVAERCEQ